MERHAPAGYDPAGDDMTVPFAIKLVEQDAKIDRMMKLLRLICQTDRNYEIFDCPSGGAIRIELQALINE